MLTTTRVNKIIDIMAKEYPSIKNKSIRVSIQKHRTVWSCATSPTDYELLVSKNYFNNDGFLDMFLPYLADEFGLDLSWCLADMQSVIDALVLMHELGHAIQTSEMFLDDNTLRADWIKFSKKMNKTYRDFGVAFAFEDYKTRQKAYRQIPYEYESDRIAAEIFNKYNVKLLSILTGKTQKELKAIRESKMNVLQEA